MLNRMVELATQSANGTYSTLNRGEMQKEIEQLKTEINRISDSANFNGKFLFNAASGATEKITLHVGETSDNFNQIGVTLGRMATDSIGSTTLGMVADIDISDVAGAKDAIDIANAAIDAISSMRSTFGALQNRLDHTINNLGVQTENITAAESRIRDVDMAKEMMAYTKNNILVQASQAMLAQANQVPQGVLQLLQ